MTARRRLGGERPRDELGRPLAWEAENQLALEDYASLSIEQNHELGIGHFNSGRFFPAHEAWEGAWVLAKGSSDEEFFKSLAQLGAGYTHMARGNARGARVLCGRFLSRAAPYGPCHQGIDIRFLMGSVSADALQFGEAEVKGSPLPQIASVQIRRC